MLHPAGVAPYIVIDRSACGAHIRPSLLERRGQPPRLLDRHSFIRIPVGNPHRRCLDPPRRKGISSRQSARAIHELAGHRDLATTQRYRHRVRPQSKARSRCWINSARLWSWQPAGNSRNCTANLNV